MNTLSHLLFSIPLTHSLLILTTTTIITIIATTQQYLISLLSAYVILASYALYKNYVSWLLCLFCITMCSLLVIGRMQLQTHQYRSHQNFLKTCVTIQGTIEQINRSTLIKDQTTIVITTNNIYTKRAKLTIPKKIALFFPTEHVRNLQEYNTITVYNIQLEQAQPDSDYQRYLIKEGFWAVARGTNYTNYDIQIHPLHWQQKILLAFKQKLNTLSSSLFEPLFLGKKEKNIDGITIQHKSVYWGIAHHMARSGAHLAILFGLIMLLLHYTQLPYALRYFLCIFLLLGYAIISQSSISFLRALFMILLHIIAKLRKHIPSSLHTLTITTLATLIYNPMQLFFLDFQLSFGITYIIIWLFNIKNSKTIAFYKHRLVRF